MKVNGQLHASGALLQRKNRWYPLNRRPSGPQSRSGRDGEKENLQPLLGLESMIIQPVAQRYTAIPIRGSWVFLAVYIKRRTIITCIIKVKVFLCLTKYPAIKVYWGTGDICILNLRTKWRWVVSFTPRPPHPPGTHSIEGWVGPRVVLEYFLLFLVKSLM
jgi:hypothetical protein